MLPYKTSQALVRLLVPLILEVRGLMFFFAFSELMPLLLVLMASILSILHQPGVVVSSIDCG